MRYILLFLIIFSAIAGTSGAAGCGCSAWYVVPKDGGEIKVQFREVTAETVGGYTDCGFKDIPIKVSSARVRGSEMGEIKDDRDSYGGKYLYVAPADFDAAKDIVTIEWKGTTYTSRLDSAKRNGDSVFFNLK